MFYKINFGVSKIKLCKNLLLIHLSRNKLNVLISIRNIRNMYLTNLIKKLKTLKNTTLPKMFKTSLRAN